MSIGRSQLAEFKNLFNLEKKKIKNFELAKKEKNSIF